MLETKNRSCRHEALPPNPSAWLRRDSTPEKVMSNWTSRAKAYVVAASLVERLSHSYHQDASYYLFDKCDYAYISVSETERTFCQLARKWETETEHLSSYHDLFMHPSYQQIIGLGSEAVPMILRDLNKEPQMWFWALSSITRANPIPDEAAGDLDKMTAAWLEWGKQQGLL